MLFEIKIGKRIATVTLIEQRGNHATIQVDDIIYDIDISKIDNGIYSLLHDNCSYRISVSEKETSKELFISNEEKDFNVSIIDAETRYLQSKKDSSLEGGDNIISSPMPGKVVSIPVNEGDNVKKGDTVIIISAMKMESEYKTTINGIVKKIYVTENTTIEGNQPLIFIE